VHTRTHRTSSLFFTQPERNLDNLHNRNHVHHLRRRTHTLTIRIHPLLPPRFPLLVSAAVVDALSLAYSTPSRPSTNNRPRGLTSPFLRLAALNAPPTPVFPSTLTPLQLRIAKLKFSIYSLLTRPSYLIPLVINLTGSVWFFVLIGGAELSLTVPIVNSLALGFTALGDWIVGRLRGEEKRVTIKGVVGGGLVVGGVWVCFLSKM
jgi:hypothetical protein